LLFVIYVRKQNASDSENIKMLNHAALPDQATLAQVPLAEEGLAQAPLAEEKIDE
jgi:hypothetical protein